jgi:gentisate 1,2-dioxygenase
MSIPADRADGLSQRRAAFYRSLSPHHLAPLWESLHSLVPRQPATKCEVALWRYEDVRPLLMSAGELITAEEAERRVLIFENPGLPGQACITQTLYAGLQLILPGEIAPCHRHTQSALRFIVEGAGAFTAVNGERAYMNQWDLILTPQWSWHDHGNETAGPMVWLDGLDIPLVRFLDAGFAESLPGRSAHPQTSPPGDSLARFGANLRPVRPGPNARGGAGSLFIYPYARWRQALEDARRGIAWDSHDGLKMEFTDPRSGGSVMPTISAFSQLIPAGFTTSPLRSTDGGVYVVVEGQGNAQIGAMQIDLRPGDVFVVPAWHERRLSAERDLVLFSYSDKATQQRLGLWREQPLREETSTSP